MDYDKLTVLEAPHRLADAIFRDSLLDGTLFRLSDVGRAITDATPRDATSLFRYSPTSLLFGMWDSTGPKGGLGSKFQRAYVSEIVGFDAVVGKKVRSRIDPLQIEKVASQDRVFNSADPEQVWTHEPADAEKEKDKLVYASRGSESGEAGQPSKINHGNIAPSIDSSAGGVTISKAMQTTVISFAALRRLRFKGFDREAENAAPDSDRGVGNRCHRIPARGGLRPALPLSSAPRAPSTPRTAKPRRLTRAKYNRKPILGCRNPRERSDTGCRIGHRLGD